MIHDGCRGQRGSLGGFSLAGGDGRGKHPGAVREHTRNESKDDDGVGGESSGAGGGAAGGPGVEKKRPSG